MMQSPTPEQMRDVTALATDIRAVGTKYMAEHPDKHTPELVAILGYALALVSARLIAVGARDLSTMETVAQAYVDLFAVLLEVEHSFKSEFFAEPSPGDVT